MRAGKIDKVFLFSFAILILSGFLIFTSASLGLLARTGGQFRIIALKQFAIGILLGSLVLYLASRIQYTVWRKYALFIFLFTLILSFMVFVPGVGWEHGGAKRWVSIAGISFQPSEFLKIGLVIYFAGWLAKAREKISRMSHGFFPLCILLGLAGTSLLLEPDTGTFLVLFFALIGMYISAGARFRDIAILGLLCVLAVGALFIYRPYIKDRVLTFLDPSRDPLGSGYQIQQSLIAIGSGGFFGRGFGQSIQKFNYLPEPVGDSIFAVAGEEFGFVGGTALILLYVFFALRGFKIATRSTDPFGRLLAVGIVILIVSGSFINISSMLGVLPLTGIPLIFVSHGGTAVLVSIAEVGIVLNISERFKYKK